MYVRIIFFIITLIISKIKYMHDKIHPLIKQYNYLNVINNYLYLNQI